MKSSRKKLKALATNELIGLDAEVKKSTDPTLDGLKGTIVDETMQTLTLEVKGVDKKIDKKSVVLWIRFPDEPMEIAGKELLQRPEERLKKLWRKV